ncbi:MAG: HD domain-containing protein [Owenweeksia sp.]|nr:HD domain-containing protein [Owenweeksia sp.]
MQDQILHKIYHYANAAHGNQMRKYSNERYMVHPQRVMKLVADYRPHTSLLAAALLHDVLEDTHVTAPELLEYLNGVMQPTNARDTLKLVLELTDVYEKESYPQLEPQEAQTNGSR